MLVRDPPLEVPRVLLYTHCSSFSIMGPVVKSGSWWTWTWTWAFDGNEGVLGITTTMGRASLFGIPRAGGLPRFSSANSVVAAFESGREARRRAPAVLGLLRG